MQKRKIAKKEKGNMWKDGSFSGQEINFAILETCLHAFMYIIIITFFFINSRILTIMQNLINYYFRL